MTTKELEAQLLARQTDRLIYINRYKSQIGEILICETARGSLCCGVVAPDGRIARIVQDPFARVNRTEETKG